MLFRSESYAIGLGQMNLHGFLARERILYGSEEGLDFTNVYFACVLYAALTATNELAVERGESFVGFEESDYYSGAFFEKYTTQDFVPVTERVKEIFERSCVHVPTREDWAALAARIKEGGMYNRNLQAVPPTGSISYSREIGRASCRERV